MTVSVLIPCRNAARWIDSAIRSIENQSYKDVEIVIVDDGSTDGSLQAISARRSSQIKLISKKCGSAAKARNLAFRNSTGSFVKFFDADDLLGPETLRLQMKRLQGSESAVASAEWGRFYKDDLSTFSRNKEEVWKDMDAREWLVNAWRNARPMMQPGIFLFSRNLAESVGPWNEELSLIDDFEFFARILCHASEVRFTEGACLFYRSGLTESLSAQKTRRAAESMYEALMLGTGYLLQQRPDDCARLSCANVLQQFIYDFYPDHADLCDSVAERVLNLGGSDLTPSGPPAFQQLRRFVGWKVARRIERGYRGFAKNFGRHSTERGDK